MMIRSIKTVLFSTVKVRVSASVSLWDQKNKEIVWFSKYSFKNSDYLTITPNTSLTIRYIKDNTDDWSRQEQIYLTNKNIGQFKFDLRAFYRIFQRPELFKYDDNNIPVDVEKGNRNIIISAFDSGQVCGFEPAIITTEENLIRPGVIMRINVKNYAVPLTVSEFESFVDIIDGIKLYDLGLHMIKLFLLMTKTSPELFKPDNPPPPNVSMATLYKEAEDVEVSLNPVITQPSTLDEL